MNKEEIIGFINYIHENKEEVKPAIKAMVDVILEFGPEFKEIIEEINNYTISLTTRTIQRFEMEGFSREEAILLTLNKQLSVGEAFNNYKKK
ncbi:MAG: hypothetical protein WCS33_03115 [Candidatus Caldatribacteriota bacterium]